MLMMIKQPKGIMGILHDLGLGARERKREGEGD
jgi:hypothetical protein